MSNKAFKRGMKMLFPGEVLWRPTARVPSPRSFSALQGQKTTIDNWENFYGFAL
jgi:hypothetical protein